LIREVRQEAKLLLQEPIVLRMVVWNSRGQPKHLLIYGFEVKSAFDA